MPNPWTGLPASAPYEHPQDANDLYNHFNASPVSKRPHTEMLPNPFVGHPEEAQVFLLTKFPLYNAKNLDDYAEVAGYQEACRRSLTFENTGCPFFFLDPAFQTTAGHQWWEPKLSRLVQDCGHAAVVKKVMSVAYFPYHMETFRKPEKPIFTQRYTFELVRQARNQGKLILVMTFSTEWGHEIKRLNPLLLSSSQNLSITPDNVQGGRYADIVKAINA